MTDIPLVQLNKADSLIEITSGYIKEIEKYASGIGPDKKIFSNVPYEVALRSVQMMHESNLIIHPYTFKADHGIASMFKNNFADEEMYFYCCLGMDGIFTEFPDLSRETIDLMGNFTAWGKYKDGKCAMDCHQGFPQTRAVHMAL